MRTALSANLKRLCSTHRSISEVCREMGINRHQFGRYLNGSSMPSSYTLHKISRYFEIPVDDLLRSNDDFEKMYQSVQTGQHVSQTNRFQNLLQRTLLGHTKELRHYTGYYHSFFYSPTNTDKIVCALVYIYEHEGQFFSKSIERGVAPDKSWRYCSKYEGLVTYLGNNLVVVELETLANDAIVETVLFPSYRTRLQFLTGLTFGVTPEVHHNPFATMIVWKYLGVSTNIRRAMAQCGLYSLDSPQIPTAVRSRLLSESPHMVNCSEFRSSRF